MTLDPAPRGATRNWQPAEKIEDYLSNCREGLETYSDRRAAKLLGWPRVRVYRAIMMASLPKELFEHLVKRGVGSRSMAQIAQIVLKNSEKMHDVDRCPHCGEPTRIRARVGDRERAAIEAWLAGEAPPERVMRR